ncbi:hypothetical protein SK128_007328 [Halocaridina rubra]|uniref:Innexin n=1 Tax=Halocaridina rubra TaxID=373956 RepID=A0AAN8XES2_HALRR
MVFKAFSSLKIKVVIKPVVDNLVFRLHYKFTYAMFMVFALLTTLYDAIGNKIDCMAPVDDGNEEAFKDVVDSYCFIMGTYTVDRHHGRKIGVEVPHTGVGPRIGDEAITYHTYYQWVPFVLFLQGILFYLPHFLWKICEGGLFRSIIQNLSIRDYLGYGKGIRNYFNREEQFDALTKYIKDHMIYHKSWAFKFFFFEGMNLVVVICMIYFTDWFLGGEFLQYGTSVMEVIGLEPENRTDPMSYIFPRMAKCTFKYFGSSGTVQIRDILCLIATNIVNEKIYLFLWIWLIILTAATSLWLLLRILMIILPFFRHFVLRMYVREEMYADLATVLKNATLSDWFLMVNLGRNMDNMVFSEFIGYFAKELAYSTDTLAMDDLDTKKPLMRT